MWKLTLYKICMQVCLNLQNVSFWLYCYLFLTSHCRKENSSFKKTILLIASCLKIESKQKLLNLCTSVKYLFLLLFQAFVSLFYPGDQKLPDGDVFSSLIWCTLDVNVSDQKIFSFLFFLALYFCPSIDCKLLLCFLFLGNMESDSRTDWGP